ncbi:MAG: hypothetical protein H5T50_06405 [Nitrososphaeria archaeon]|nr:hypothetical protein [Nitrososphaeria archaeon]
MSTTPILKQAQEPQGIFLNEAQTQAPQGFSLNEVQTQIKDEYEIVQGILSLDTRGNIILPNGEAFTPEQFSVKAKWQYARLMLGKKLADNKYFQYTQKYGKEKALDCIVNEALLVQPQRQLQFFIKEVVDKRSKNPNATVRIVCAIATLKHSLIPREEVKKIIHDYYMSKGAEYKNAFGYQTYYLQRIETDLGGWKLGISFDTGKINTDKAIKIGASLYIEKCTNVVSFLGFRGFGGDFQPINTRILRVTDEGTKDRIVQTLKAIDFQAEKIASKIMENGKQKITFEDASKIIYVLGKSYQIGEKVRNWLLEEFKRIPDEYKTSYELAMVLSNAPINPMCPIKENTKNARANLSTIAGIVLAYSDIKELITKCDEQIKAWTEKLQEEMR